MNARSLVGLLLALAACRSEPPSRQEFLLAEAPASAASATGPAASERANRLPPLRVKPLVARSFLAREEIAFREGDVRSGAYVYRSWSEPPAESVTRRLVEVLRERGAFASVDGSAARPIGVLTLSGELLGLHEVTDEAGERPRGIAELELVVEVASADPAVLPRRTILHARREVAARDESMDALVRAISAALEQALAELAPKIEAAAASD